ncbi:MAG: hypothetical protein M3Y86_07000 [Verrucomicrobiota bacterium]|nr:hypothetical protein [Verrucomicrobiota bacterium]
MFLRCAALSLVAFGIGCAPLLADPPSLTPDQLAHATHSDMLTIPTPGELFAALSKPGKPDWAAQYRGPVSSSFSDRAQIALNLGGLVADGFIAVEAQDSQQVKNIGGDLIKLAKALGVSENVLSRGKSINDFAENDEWDALQEELEATQNEVKASMLSNRDNDYVILVSLGGWIRGTQVVSGLIMRDYNADAAKVLRQPALVSYIQAKVKEMSPELQNDPLVKSVSSKLSDIQKLVTFSASGIPTAEEVKKLNEAVTNLMAEIQRKPDTK